MNKKVIIDSCNNCPYFDDAHYGYNETCTLLNRRIPHTTDLSYTRAIPEDCTLDNTEEKVLGD